jgi:hypothetical protein
MKRINLGLPLYFAVIFTTAIFAATSFVACASTSPVERSAEKAAESVSPTQQNEVLEDKGTTFGITTPTWVVAYIMGGNLAVERLADYKGLNCFVIESADENKDYAVAWVSNSANGPRAVAEKISTTVSSTASSALSGEKGQGTESNLKAAAEAMSNANFTGLTRVGDWWQIVRNKSTDVTETRAYALYTIEMKTLNEQVARYLAQFVNQNNAALSAAERAIYNDLITQIRNVGGINN